MMVKAPYSWQKNLSDREIEVCKYVAQALSNKQIAIRMGIQEQSVKNLLREASMKLGTLNRVDVALRVHNINLSKLPT